MEIIFLDGKSNLRKNNINRGSDADVEMIQEEINGYFIYEEFIITEIVYSLTKKVNNKHPTFQ